MTTYKQLYFEALAHFGGICIYVFKINKIWKFGLLYLSSH